MTVLIKSSTLAETGRIQRFGGGIRPAAADALSHEALLEARIVELRGEIVALNEALPIKLADACEDGAREALKERSDAETMAHEELKAALRAAEKRFSLQLESWDSLAVGIAKAVIEQVFTNSSDRASSIISAVRHRLQRLDAGSIVRLRVSDKDFADPDQIEAAAAELEGHLELVTDPKLKSGDCIIDLKLGHVDLGMGAQWARISELLDRLADEGPKS